MLEQLRAASPADAVATLALLPLLMQALCAAATLGIADLLAGAPRTVDELAQATSTHAGALYRILRALAGMGLFEELPARRFALTPAGACLRSDAPDSQRAYVTLFADPDFWRATELLHTVRTGEPAWDHALGAGPFPYLAAHPELAAHFNAAMSDGMRQRQLAVAAYDFAPHQTVVDVGGNRGTLLAAILQAHPALRGVLFDLPQVVASAPDELAAAGVTDRCTVVGGDFFAAVPTGGDCYLLSNLIHDWEDEPATAILRRCGEAMPPGTPLLLVERVLPSANGFSLAVLSDLNMLRVGGVERSELEYRALVAAAGFSLQTMLRSLTPYAVLVATRD